MENHSTLGLRTFRVLLAVSSLATLLAVVDPGGIRGAFLYSGIGGAQKRIAGVI